MEDKIYFNPESYEVKTCELDGKSITYRAYENIVYCANPVDPSSKNEYLCARSTGAEYIPYYKNLGYDGIIVTDHFF